MNDLKKIELYLSLLMGWFGQKVSWVFRQFFKKIFFLASIILFGACFQHQASASQLLFKGAKSYTLDNGLKLYVVPRHRLPIVTHMVVYHVGGRHSLPGQGGIAHFLEHLMFKFPIKSFGSYEIPQYIASIGGDDGAYTSPDVTVYYQEVHKKYLKKMMEIEVERSRGLQFSKELFETEKKVILEERGYTIEQKYTGQLWEKIRHILYANTQRKSVIGSEKEIRGLTINQVRDFYDKWYRPDNMSVIIVGDVDPANAYEMAKKTYGFLKADERAEPLQLLKESFAHKPKAQKHLEKINFKHSQARERKWWKVSMVPGFGQTDTEGLAALELFSHYLNSADGLYQDMVIEKKVAVYAGAGHSISPGESEFILFALPKGKISYDETNQYVKAFIEKFIKEGMSEQVLERIKTSFETSVLLELDSNLSVTKTLSELIKLDPDLKTANNALKIFENLQVEDLKEAAKQLLNSQNVVIAETDIKSSVGGHNEK